MNAVPSTAKHGADNGSGHDSIRMRARAASALGAGNRSTSSSTATHSHAARRSGSRELGEAAAW